MGEDGKPPELADLAEAIAKGTTKAVLESDLYDDLGKPGVREFGLAIRNVLRITFAPLTAANWVYEQATIHLPPLIQKRLDARKVPEERVTAPALGVAAPAVQGFLLAAGEPTLRELYANLLASAMDADTADDVHPAFAEFLRQITPDEAKLLRNIAGQGNIRPMVPNRPLLIYSGLVSLKAKTPEAALDETTYSYQFRNFTRLQRPHSSDCERLDSIPSYIDNLMRLGIVEIVRARTGLGTNQEAEILDRYLFELAEERHISWFTTRGEKPPEIIGPVTNSRTRTEQPNLLQFTAFGSQFYRTCLSEIEDEKTA